MTEPDPSLEYTLELTPIAFDMLNKVRDRRHREALTQQLEKLKIDPEKQGKSLTDKLKGYRSVRAVGQRYRIIYSGGSRSHCYSDCWNWASQGGQSETELLIANCRSPGGFERCRFELF